MRTERITMSPEQKEVKQKIMEELMKALFKNIEDNQHIFDGQSSADLIISCLIMFNRKSLSSFFMFSNALPIRASFMDQLFEQIRIEVEEKIKSTPAENPSHLQ